MKTSLVFTFIPYHNKHAVLHRLIWRYYSRIWHLTNVVCYRLRPKSVQPQIESPYVQSEGMMTLVNFNSAAVLVPIFGKDPIQLPLCIYEYIVEEKVFDYFKSCSIFILQHISKRNMLVSFDLTLMLGRFYLVCLNHYILNNMSCRQCSSKSVCASAQSDLRPTYITSNS